jgi:hypothetical protein
MGTAGYTREGRAVNVIVSFNTEGEDWVELYLHALVDVHGV